MIALAVDPGRDKCGVAVCSPGRVLAKGIVSPGEVIGMVARWAAEYRADVVLVGGGTGSGPVLAGLSAWRGAPAVTAPVTKVDERATTLAARRRYFQDHPRRGWRRLVPLSFQVPPAPYDDYAAVVMAERYLRAEKDRVVPQ